MTDPDQPVEIGRFFDVHQAQFFMSVLQGSGIEAYIDQPHTGAIAPHYMFAGGGVRLFVRAEDEQHARDVLDSFEDESER